MSNIIQIVCFALVIAVWLPTKFAIAEPYIAPYTLSVRQIIVKQAIVYATPVEPLLRVAQCESHMNPKALNPKDVDGLPAYGLFQFKKATFNYFAKKAGIIKPDIWNPEHQAQAAAYAFSVGQKKQWGCK